MNYAGIDFETFFDDECSVKPLGVDGYIAHPRFEAYLVGISTSTGLKWVGHPNDAPWEEISGPDWEWCAHNASFDERVYQSLGIKFRPRLWNCTADLCAFTGLPRALANAVETVFGVKVSKSQRDAMKGVLFSSLPEDKQEQLRSYCLTDADWALKLWDMFSGSWPKDEQELSRMTREQGWGGLLLDQLRLKRGIQHLQILRYAAELLIPWGNTAANLSYPALVAECNKVGISAPTSIDMKSEECAIWEEKYGDQYPWIDGMRTLRRTNTLIKKMKSMLARVRPSDGRMQYELKYFGAQLTGRWSGGSGGERQAKQAAQNMQNLPVGELFGEDYFLGKKGLDGVRAPADGKRFLHYQGEGVDLRHCIVAPPGHQFLISDEEQIEPRVLWWWADDQDSLALVRKGISPYVIHAITTMGLTMEQVSDKGSPEYKLAKARVLSLGFGAGWLKFLVMARLYLNDEDCKKIFAATPDPREVTAFEYYVNKCRISEWKVLLKRADEKTKNSYVNSWKIVMDFRRTNPKIVALWKELDQRLKATVGKGSLEIPMPNGRELIYHNISEFNDHIVGTICKFGKMAQCKLYGSLLAENITQGMARDVFANHLLAIKREGHKIVLHAHDEAVIEAPMSVPTSAIEDIMKVSPPWAPDLPVSAKCISSPFYMK